jgi:hypothetical protein
MSDIDIFLHLIWLPGEVRELRVPKAPRGTISGCYSNPDALARDAKKLSLSEVSGVYLRGCIGIRFSVAVYAWVV